MNYGDEAFAQWMLIIRKVGHKLISWGNQWEGVFSHPLQLFNLIVGPLGRNAIVRTRPQYTSRMVSV